MSPSFSDDFKETVRTRTDLVSLIAESLALSSESGGREFVGLCPFHDDHKPSMRVYPDRQTFRCWVCDVGGDCYTWVMKRENLDFRQALEMLAERAHLEMPQSQRNSGDPQGPKKSDLYELLSWAEVQFHQCLLTSPAAEPARQYLSDRRFSAETIQKFHIGYNPPGWDWLMSRAASRFAIEQLATVDLIRPNKSGTGYYDTFQDRVVFPIHDERGRAVAFGGRIMPGPGNENRPKYLNSSETPVFTKNRLVYGLDVAREAISQAKSAVVVEGYTDCIFVHQYGVPNVVGTLGTSLTENHVTVLKRFAPKVVLVFDGDSAGQKAAERALAKFVLQNVDLRVLTIPDGDDPDEYLEKHGVESFQQLIDNAVEAFEYKLQTSVKRHGVSTVHSRQQVLTEVLELLAEARTSAGNPREDLILGKLSHRLGMAEGMVRQALSEQRRTHQGKGGAQSQHTIHVDSGERSSAAQLMQGKLSKEELIECELLEIVLSSATAIERIRCEIGVEEFSNTILRDLMQRCYDLAEVGETPTFDKLTTCLEDPELKGVVVWIDDRARERGIVDKLNDTHATSSKKSFLEQSLDIMKWRRETRSHEEQRGKMVEQPEAPLKWNQDAKALLKQAAEHHRKRAARKTTN